VTRLFLLVAAWLAAWPAASAEPPGQLPGLLREPLAVAVSPASGKPVTLEAMVTRPAGAERHPLLILSHGAPRDPADRAKTNPARYSAIAIEFARRAGPSWPWCAGVMALPGPLCREQRRLRQARLQPRGPRLLDDILAALPVLARQPGIDAGRVMLVGISPAASPRSRQRRASRPGSSRC